jgi:hypothetical protein
MIVKDLIKLLNKLDGNLPVLLSKDPEGNGYSTLYSCDTGGVDTLEYYMDDYYSDQHTDEEAGLWPGEREHLIKIVVLSP